MKILIVHNSYRVYGGEDTVVAQEMDAYKQLGYEVELFELSNSKLSAFDLLFCLFNPRSYRELRRAIREFQPHLVQLHNFVFKLSPAVFYAVPKSIPLIQTIHNYRYMCPSGTLFYKGKVNKDYRTFRGRLRNISRGVYRDSALETLLMEALYQVHYLLGSFKRVNRFVFLTDFAQKIHVDYKPLFQRAKVKPNFLMHSPEPVGRNEKDIDLFFAGRITEEKGLMDVLAVLTKHTELTIVLVGGGGMEEELRKQVDLISHIDYKGKLSREETMRLMARSKFTLFPSIWYEGMPMTIIEAMSLKSPVICRDLGAMSTMIQHGRNGLKYGNTEELDQLLSELKQQDVQALAENGFGDYQNLYSKEKGIENIKYLVNEVVG